MDKLKEQGWYLTEDGLKKIPEDVDKSDTRKIIQAALDIDFRDIACGALSSDITRKDETIPGKIVLQITKIRNISAPKANEESKTAPRFLQIDLTDGVNQIQALEMEHIPVLSLNTPPGTKIYMKNDKIPLMQGILMLKSYDVQLLGGKVPALIEKWEISRTLLKYARGGRIMSGTSGPPPWIQFGQKIQQNINNSDKNFKSLGGGTTDKDKDSKENNEFDAMRNEAIAEAAKGAAKKIFGGGNQQIVDHNVKKILEKGFSEEDAKNALKSTRNNLERALYNLKRREEYKSARGGEDYRGGSSEKPSRNPTTVNNSMGGSSSRGGGISGGRSSSGRENFTNRKSGGKDELGTSTKPAGNVSLFDFLTDKLPNSSESTVLEKPATNSTASSSRYESSNMRSERSTRSNNNDYSSKPYYNNNNSNHHNSHHQQHHHYSDNRSHNNNSSGHQTSSSNIPNNNQSNNRSTSSGFNSTTPSSATVSAAPSASSGTKFENNISSSFQAAANRNYSQDDRNTNNNRNSSRGGRGNNNNSSYRAAGGGSDRHDDNTDRYNRDRDSQQRNNSNYGQMRNQRINDRDRNERAGSYQSSNASHYQEHSQTQNRSTSGYDSNRNNRNDNQLHKNGYDSRGGQHHSGGRGGHQQSSSRYQPKDNASNSYQQHQPPPQHHYQQQQQSNNSRNYNNDNSRHSSSSYHHNQQQNQNSINSDTSKINKLIEETSKLKLESNNNQKNVNRHTMQQHQQPSVQQRNQHHSQHHQQQQQQQQPPQPQIVTMVSHHQTHHPSQSQPPQMQAQQQLQQQQHSLTHQQQQQQNAYAQLPNGYTYDPNKIMGFQNKETNDFAMTLLKSQGIPTALGSAGGPPPPQIQLGHHPSQQPQPFATGPTFVIPQQSQSVVHQQSNHHVAAVAAAVHQVQQQQHHQQPPPPAAFGMNSGESWNWKIGDRCLAKYWDDGRYYEAEITGISDKTCVVFYLGYGNHEEVLKSDCLPITDAQNRVINFGTTQSVQPSPIPSGALSRGVPNRYRGERQMYVPPPKREV